MDIRLDQIKHWLQHDLQMRDFHITAASADASFRRYFRIRHDQGSDIIMDAPPEKEDCSDFIAIAQQLLQCGLNVPVIKAYSAEQGFLLLSDLGSVMYLDQLNKPDALADQLYKAAIDALLTMQCNSQLISSKIDLPLYHADLLLQEMNLFRDWLLTQFLQLDQDHHLDQDFALLQQAALQQTQVFVHRDYHSRNLTYLADQAPGILDFQDAVIGPISYDLVSLLRDCYIQWPTEQVALWRQYYFDQARHKALLTEMSDNDLIRDFDLMGIQRHLKASGIFARLYLRDNKPNYLKDIPLTLNYIIDASENYPQLQGLGDFIKDTVLPTLMNKLANLSAP